MADWLSHSNANATRNQPISSRLADAMSFVKDMGIVMDVYSGGQPASGSNRVGSTRHDHGNAADVTFRRDGRVLDWNNPDDLPILSDIVARARANGVTGIGAGDDYMGAGRFHVGFGEPSVWGAGGRSANAPEWLRLAYNSSASPRPNSAVGAINSAAPPIMRASSPPPRQGNSFFSPLSGLLASVQLPQVNMPAMSPQMQRGALAPLLGTVAGRTALWNAFMPSNIGAAPTVTQGHSGPGTRAYAVNSSGVNPVMLASAGGGGRSHGNLDTNTHMNMDVYRANAGVLGGSGFTQSNIDRALSEGRTLFTL